MHEDGAGRLKKRYKAMLNFISKSAAGRHIREVEAFLLDNYGISPSTSRKYLEWAERYGKIVYTNPSRNRVKTI